MGLEDSFNSSALRFCNSIVIIVLKLLPLEDQKTFSLLFKDQSVFPTTLISDHLHELNQRHEFHATNSTLRTHRHTALSTLCENGGVVKQPVLTTLLNEEIIYCEFIAKCRSSPLI